jgi:hypothetical protein
MEYSPHR